MADLTRRTFLKGAAYAAPLVVGFTLLGSEVADALPGRKSNQTQYDSKPPRGRHVRTLGPYEGEYDGQPLFGRPGGGDD
jgi:hypothetical protein